jgi:hypothetical protein
MEKAVFGAIAPPFQISIKTKKIPYEPHRNLLVSQIVKNLL